MGDVVRAFVAVGSNLGDRAGAIARAVDRLRATEGMRVVRVSDLLENPAVGGPAESPAFLNGVIELETALGPRELLGRLLEIEQELGRVRRERWGPRVIDLDLILYGDRVINEEGLMVPHPRMHERGFVMIPLAQIAPEVVHPVLGKTVGEIANGRMRDEG